MADPTQTPEADSPDSAAVPAGPAGADKLLRVGELATACDKTVRALHLYEELGLLRPEHRTKGGFRLYRRSAVDRVQWIGRLQDADFSLTEIKDFLRDLEEQRVAPEAMTRLRSVFEKKLGDVREQRQRLQRLEADLLEGLLYLDGCKTCEPVHMTSECGGCRLHGHDGNQPIMVAGIHHG